MKSQTFTFNTKKLENRHFRVNPEDYKTEILPKIKTEN